MLEIWTQSWGNMRYACIVYIMNNDYDSLWPSMGLYSIVIISSHSMTTRYNHGLIHEEISQLSNSSILLSLRSLPKNPPVVPSYRDQLTRQQIIHQPLGWDVFWCFFPSLVDTSWGSVFGPPNTSWGSAFRGSKHFLRRYLEDPGRVGFCFARKPEMHRKKNTQSCANVKSIFAGKKNDNSSEVFRMFSS